MRRNVWGSLLGLLLVLGSSSCVGDAMEHRAQPIPAVGAGAEAAPNPPPPDPTYALEYWVEQVGRSPVHIVRIPAGAGWQVVPWVGDRLLPLPAIVQQLEREGQPVAVALNAGFFDPMNQLTTSYIVQDGQVVADPRNNPRLMENPDLRPYLGAILNRSEFRVYACGAAVRYGIAQHQDPSPNGCQVQQSVGAGPRLLPQLTDEPEGFWRMVQGQVVRDAIGRDRPNARSAIGLTAAGDVLLVMAERGDGSSGLTLPDLAALLARLGAVEALNLDGGSSSGLWVQGQAVPGSVDAAGTPQWRPIHSAWLVVPQFP